MLPLNGVKVVELAPPGVETKLFRGEFEKELKGQKGMRVDVLVAKAISGIEAGKTEIRPGLSNVLKFLSRLAPSFALNLVGQTAQASLDRIARKSAIAESP